MSEIVRMPVKAMGEYCINCPELDIDIVTKEQYELEVPEEGRTQVKTAKYENVLRCKHCDRCAVIFEHGNQPLPEKEEVKPAKKTTKKTTATKTTTKKTAAKK